MYECPNCRLELSKLSQDHGLFWSCESCNGRPATVVQLRKSIEPKFINQLWIAARSDIHPRKRVCPSCDRPMVEVPVAERTGEEKPLVLDVCTTCQFVWFDPGKFGRLPEAEPREEIEKPLPPEAKEALALGRLEFVKEKQRAQERLETGSRTTSAWLRVFMLK